MLEPPGISEKYDALHEKREELRTRECAAGEANDGCSSTGSAAPGEMGVGSSLGLEPE